jgi:hypothetical protein
MRIFSESTDAVRDEIYAGVVEHGVAPMPAEVALATGLEPARSRTSTAHIETK